MITESNKRTIIDVLNSVLGIGTPLKGNEHSHHCPFCHHHKKKLQVNLVTQKWHCWVCNAKGRRLVSLLKRLHADEYQIQKIYDIYGDSTSLGDLQEEEQEIELQLPAEFKPLYFSYHKWNPVYKQALHYLKQRGITTEDIIRYNIGYCEEGMYAGRIIIPSYDARYRLNYFIARSFYDNETMKYKNPPVSRNVIMFENQIDWSQPITLVEGVFDAFSIKRNAIPILGKFIPRKLKEKIFEEQVQELYFMLDADAIEDSIKYTNYFMRNNIKVKNIIPEDGDIADLGFEKSVTLQKTHPYSGWDQLVLDKLKII